MFLIGSYNVVGVQALSMCPTNNCVKSSLNAADVSEQPAQTRQEMTRLGVVPSYKPFSGTVRYAEVHFPLGKRAEMSYNVVFLTRKLKLSILQFCGYCFSC